MDDDPSKFLLKHQNHLPSTDAWQIYFLHEACYLVETIAYAYDYEPFMIN